jgi:CBS-domain-containing membrane protein
MSLVRAAPHSHNQLMSWTVADVMTTKVVTVSPQTSFKDCVDLIRIHGVSALPVIDEQSQVLGIVSEADLLVKEERRDAKRRRLGIVPSKNLQVSARTAADVMTYPAITIGPAATVPAAARLMHKLQVKRLPVVDGTGKLIGIASRIDLLKTFMRSEESIRREIAENVLRKMLSVDPKTIDIEVTDGLVRLGGEVETKSLAELLVQMVERVEGSVGVEDRLTYRFDDSHLRPEAPPGALQLSAQERQPH